MTQLKQEGIRAINPEFVEALSNQSSEKNRAPKNQHPLKNLPQYEWDKALELAGITHWSQMKKILGNGESQAKKKFNHPEEITQPDLDKLRSFYETNRRAITLNSKGSNFTYCLRDVFESTLDEKSLAKVAYHELCSRAIVETLNLIYEDGMIHSHSAEMSYLIKTAIFLTKEVCGQAQWHTKRLEKELQNPNYPLPEKIASRNLNRVKESLAQAEKVLAMLSAIDDIENSWGYSPALDALVQGISADGTSDKAEEVLAEYVSARR